MDRRTTFTRRAVLARHNDGGYAMADDVIHEAFSRQYAAVFNLERRDDGEYAKHYTRLAFNIFRKGWGACVKHETGGTI